MTHQLDAATARYGKMSHAFAVSASYAKKNNIARTIVSGTIKNQTGTVAASGLSRSANVIFSVVRGKFFRSGRRAIQRYKFCRPDSGSIQTRRPKMTKN